MRGARPAREGAARGVLGASAALGGAVRRAEERPALSGGRRREAAAAGTPGARAPPRLRVRVRCGRGAGRAGRNGARNAPLRGAGRRGKAAGRGGAVIGRAPGEGVALGVSSRQLPLVFSEQNKFADRGARPSWMFQVTQPGPALRDRRVNCIRASVSMRTIAGLRLGGERAGENIEIILFRG